MLDPLLVQPTRLQIMALLFRNRQASAVDVARALSLTPGNLASHVAKLEEAGYVASARALVGVGFQVRLSVTPMGDAAFRAHARALQTLLDEARASQADG